jgi:hypothetical protein
MSVGDTGWRFDKAVKSRIMAMLAYVQALVQTLKSDGPAAMLTEATEHAKALVQYDPSAAGLKRAGQGGRVIQVVITLVITAVIAYIGLIILADVEKTGDFAANSTFSNSSTALMSGIESVYGLMPVVFIALFVGVIIAALMSVNVR